MTTFPINEAKIKMAWREKYLTDGANEQALAHPRGAYRGFWPIPRPAPDDHIRIAIDPFALGVDVDSFAIYADRTNGFSVSIRETTDVDLDCAALFPVVGATEDWWVSIDAAYTPNVTTTANYRVDKVDPRILNPDAIVLGVLPMASGDVTIHTAGVYADRSIPSPTARQHVADYVAGDEPWGLFDGLSKWNLGTGPNARTFGEPTIQTVVGLVAADKFQLMGTYYVGLGAFGSSEKYFRLLISNDTVNRPLNGSNKGQIKIWEMLQSDGMTNLTPSADADAQGFYKDPWIVFDFDWTPDLDYTGDLRVQCFQKKTLATLENDPASGFPNGCMDFQPHAAEVRTPDITQTPTSLTGSELQANLISIMTAINARIQSVHYDAAPADWVLLWRSHGITLDANVTKQTSSLYFGDKGLALVHGGYIKIADGDVYAANIGAGGDDVSIMYLRSGGSGGLTFGVKSGPAAASHWDIETGWTLYSDHSSAADAFEFYGSPISPVHGIQWVLAGLGASADMHNQVYAGAAFGYPFSQTLEAAVGVARSRIYYKQREVIFTHNCSWDPVALEWTKDDLSAAMALRINPEEVTVCRKRSGAVAAWADTAAGWDSQWILGDAHSASVGHSAMVVKGDMYEEVHFALLVEFDQAAAPAAKAYHDRQGVTWHSKWTVAPTTITVMVDAQTSYSGGDDWDTLVISNADTWGANIVGTTVSHAWGATDVLHVFGRITVEN